MSATYKVKVTVHLVTKGECPSGFKVGDSWLIENGGTPSGMCADAYMSIAPAIRTFWLGGEQPWDEVRDITCRSCPDPEHLVIYEIRRLR